MGVYEPNLRFYIVACFFSTARPEGSDYRPEGGDNRLEGRDDWPEGFCFLRLGRLGRKRGSTKQKEAFHLQINEKGGIAQMVL